MSVLWAVRWALIGSIAIYALGFVVGHDVGLLMALFGAYAMPVAALACVIVQIAVVLRRKREPLTPSE